MKLTFVDLDADVVEALKKAFARFPAVSVLSGDLVSLAENTVVSPANADGLMDGGIDAAYAAAIPKVQELVRDAMRAVLRVAASHPENVRSIYCPGLCTGVGGVRPEEAAAAMASAYADWQVASR